MVKKERPIIGSFAKVSFPEFQLRDVVAKIDTGAYSGALHATGMREVSDNEGVKRLQFHLLGDESRSAETVHYRKKRVRSSNGLLEERYVIRTTIQIEEVNYMVSISLSDRTNMKKEVLIGRQFLRRHGFLVDVRIGTQYRYARRA